MKDLAIQLENRPGALAEMGEALGKAGVSVEGGGAWVVGAQGLAHFLFHDGPAARAALEAAGITVLAERDVVTVRLKQDVPGQLGMITRLGINSTTGATQQTRQAVPQPRLRSLKRYVSVSMQLAVQS